VVDRTGRSLLMAPGHPLPFDVSATAHGLNFAVFSSHATAMRLVLFADRREEPEPDCDLYLAANAWEQDLVFELPAPRRDTRWVRVIDTAEPSPRDIAEPGAEIALADTTHYTVRARSCIVLRSV
jgi:pullulanase/glycogen debranching enzyme